MLKLFLEFKRGMERKNYRKLKKIVKAQLAQEELILESMQPTIEQKKKNGL